MKALSFLLLVGLVAFMGCSADDLAGPDLLADEATVTAPAASYVGTEANFGPVPFSIVGTWKAGDSFGTVTLFIDQAAAAPALVTVSARTSMEGKGLVVDNGTPPLTILVEGQYNRDAIELLLFVDGSLLAKGEGVFAEDYSTFKVPLRYENDRLRVLEFTRF